MQLYLFSHKTMSFEICIVPFWGQGHLFPCIELCNRLTSRNVNITLIIPSTINTSLPSSLLQHPLIRIAQFPSPPPPPPHHDLAPDLERILANNPTRPVCAIVDIMMSSCSAPVFTKFHIPMVAFFTSAACSAAMELATWKAQPLNLEPGETRLLPGLPENMAITHSDLKRRPQHLHPPPPIGASLHYGGATRFPPPPGKGPPNHGGGFGFPPPPGKGPPKLEEPPPWLDDVRESSAVIINTCDDLERTFIKYITNHIEKPVWGVGPLLPEQYWNSTASALLDRDVRPNRRFSVTEEEVTQWLDSKAHGSVLYVSFGTEVGPTSEEMEELGGALESSEEAFIRVIQGSSSIGGSEEGYFGNRGMIIRGWAPQLLILSHPSTGGFLSHCGWNSTVEGLGRGVPLLAWPIRGDQYHNAKLVVSHLKLGYMVTDDMSEKITKDDIVRGIKKLMADKGMKTNAEILSAKFQHRFPRSSLETLDDFIHHIKHSGVHC
ncbi:UDP-glucosyl transferase 73B2-like [Vigna radiata var. radiata]|uniref:Glycosyltransferase n=1 Tax=Vigna radiata var. radiata TaxID=3916 RepID=A0A1S3VTJ2_VIGRR|nr:UDP-glucosyl transferase 73B2-like [Vigna radiata var. radiata]